MTDYRQLAVSVLKKVKAYCPNAATDEPQVLAWAENFQENRCDNGQDLLDAVKVLFTTAFATKPGFVPSPQMVSSIARERRADRNDRMAREEHESPRTALPSGRIQGRYLADDPAGWQYGCPTHDHKPGELEGHRIEIENRVRALTERTGCTPAEAEQAIREADRDRAEAFLTNIGRTQVAAYISGGGFGKTVPGSDKW